MRVTISDILHIEDQQSDLKNPISFVGSPLVDLSDKEFILTEDITLDFENSEEITCKRLKISNCNVKITNLNLIGSITCEEGDLILENSNIHSPDDSVDYILTITNSTVQVENCKFSKTSHFGICVDDHGKLSVKNSILSNIKIFGIVLTGFSDLDAYSTVFSDVDTASIYVADCCSAKLVDCEFTGAQKRAISAKNATLLSLEGCTIRNCLISALYVTYVEQFLMLRCNLLDCSHTALYLENVTGVIKHVNIQRCKGNGINASHNTKVLITKCRIYNTLFPPIALCESSVGLIKKTEILDSEMSGIIIRSNSKASIEDTNIANVKQFGLSISDSLHVEVKRCYIVNCGHSSIASYNGSHVKMTSCNLFGPSLYGINIFTAGRVSGYDTTICGMNESAIWAHHAGSFDLDKSVICTECFNGENETISGYIKSIDVDKILEVDPNAIIRNESKRPVSFEKGFVVGIGWYDYELNQDNSEPTLGSNATHPRCKLCGKDSFNCVFTRCGHSIYCNDCWNSLEVKPEACELCLMPTSGVVSPINCSPEGEEGICAICMEAESDSIILPCGHQTCWECSRQWFTNSMECPFCREKNSHSQRFVSYE